MHTFTYSEQGAKKLTFTLDSAVVSAFNLSAHEIKGYPIIKDIEMGCVIYGSKTQVIHVLINLIVNLAKAIRVNPGEEAPVIKMTGRIDNDRVLVIVWDNGPGIPDDIINKIFGPFFTTSDVGKDMVLGLSICHTIVTNHQGIIKVNSRVGEFTEICFDLPLKKEKDS